MDVLSSILQLATPIGLAFIALIIVRENQKDRAGEITRRDAREDAERERNAKNDERFMLLFATLSGKQETSTAQVIKSGVDSEGRVNRQIVSSEGNIKGRVTASSDASLAAIEKLHKLTDSAFQILLARPPDPMAAEKYDRALAILTAQVEAVKDDLAGVKGDVATNTDARLNTAEIAAVEVPAAVVPAEVVITDVSPAAMETIKGAMMPAPDAGDQELGEVA